MADAFKPGDIVQLKSGGPAMTVTHLVNGGKVLHTSWFAGKKNETAGFPVETVIPYKEEPKKP